MSSKKRPSDSVGCSKKMKKHDSSESESDNEGSDVSDVSDVQIDFSAFELAPCDFTGVRQLLNQLFLKTNLDLSEMSTFLIDHQLDVGIVIKETEIDQSMETDDDANEDDTVYALISVVDLSQYANFKFKTQLKNYFLELSKQHATEVAKNSIHSVLNDSKNSVGLLINERYLNLPPSISVSSFTKIKHEIEAMSKKESQYNFTHFLIICKLYKISSSKKKVAHSEENEVMWCNIEEQIFDREADSRFEFSVTKESDSGLAGSWTEDDVEMIPYRRVLLFSADKFDSIIQKMSSFIQ